MEKIIIGKCIDYAHDGRGVVRVEDFPIFVENLLIGEQVEIEITRQCKGYYLGKVIKRIKNSPNRVEPICSVYEKCGGCHLQHMNYAQQLIFKKNRVKEVLKRIGKVNVEVNDVIGMQTPYHYRNKVQVPFGMNNDNQIVAGFYQKGTHDIIDMEQCYIEDSQADEIIKTCKELFEKLKIPIYEEKEHKGTIRHVLVRKAVVTNQIMVVIVTKEQVIKKQDILINELKSRHPGITTIVQNINPVKGNVILGTQEIILDGAGYIEDYLCGLKFQISAQSFYQVNHSQTEVLYNEAIKLAQLTLTDRVLDAYCGIGTIGLIASKHAGHVAGVESVKAAVDNAIKNAKINNVNNISFYLDDAGEFMKKTVKNKITINAVFIDPPRNGCSEPFIQSLIELKPERLVYISCEPSSLARDLNILKEYYDVKVVQPVDMFPQSYHVESVVLLEKR